MKNIHLQEVLRRNNRLKSRARQGLVENYVLVKRFQRNIYTFMTCSPGAPR